MSAPKRPRATGWIPDLPGLSRPDLGRRSSFPARMWMAAYRALPSRQRNWILATLLQETPSFSLEWTIGRRNRRDYRWPAVRASMGEATLPDSLVPPREFDTLLPILFHHGMATRGICQMDIDEALMLWTLCRQGPADIVVEIGRLKGGSTFLLACAMGARGRLVSFDIDGQYDAELAAILRDTGLTDRVEIVVGDSRTSDLNKALSVDLVFVDGGHSREAVTADVEAWYPAVRPGGLICFHDATATRPNATAIPSTVETVEELFSSGSYDVVEVAAAGSLLAFRKGATQGAVP